MKKSKIPPCQNHSLSPSVWALSTASPLRTIQRLYMCRLKCFWMRLCRINRPKAALITAKQLLLIVVDKCVAVKRECACRGAIRLPDEQSEEPCEARSQEAAREHQPSEFFQNRAEGRKGSAAQSKIGEPPNATSRCACRGGFGIIYADEQRQPQDTIRRK